MIPAKDAEGMANRAGSVQTALSSYEQSNLGLQ